MNFRNTIYLKLTDEQLKLLRTNAKNQKLSQQQFLRKLIELKIEKL
jgi:hypothetical protein